MFIKRNTASLLPSLFYYCFKRGVLDAFERGNDYDCATFIDERKALGDFSLLDDRGQVISWREWKFTLSTWCRYMRMQRITRDYLDKVNKVDCLWVALPICMDFYVLGVSEWVNYPNAYMIDTFKLSKDRLHWDVNGSYSKYFRRDEIISQTQAFAYERIHKFSSEQNPRYPSKLMYETFCQMVWAMTRPLKKVEIINLGTVEDVDITPDKPKPRYKKVKVQEHII